jgi:hypothetical protein
MDSGTFDRVSRVLGSAMTRRSGIAAAVIALAGSIGAVAEAKPGRRGKQRPGKQGPCGNGSRKENACTKDSQCCTGICKTGMKNKDGKGRCRCVKKGKACAEDRNCCGGRTCAGGVCGGGGGSCAAAGGACGVSADCCAGLSCYLGTCAQGQSVATGQSCVDGLDTCADSAATCVSYLDTTPAGTYCLLATGGTCATNDDCDSHSCTSSVCDAACIANVCASGCDYTTVDDAFAALPADSIIMVAPGTYTTGVDVDKSMTVRGCGDGVILQVRSGSNGVFAGNASSACLLTLKNLTLQDESDSYGLLVGDSYLSFDVTDCTFQRGYYGLYDGSSPTTASFTNCTFAMGPGDGTGGYGMYVYGIDITLKDCTFSDSYGAMIMDGGSATIDGCTFSNQSTYGLYRYTAEAGATFSITNSTFVGGTSTRIDVSSIDATLDNVTVTGSTQAANQAAVFIGNGAFTITNTTISGNTGVGTGAALLAYATTQNTTVALGASVSITNNTATNGPGIASYTQNGSTMTITGATTAVTGNTGGDQCVTGTNYNGPWTAVANCAY